MSRFSVTLPDNQTVQVGFFHLRPDNPKDNTVRIGGQFYNGATVCTVYGVTGNLKLGKETIFRASGRSLCVLQDNFSRKTGRLLAFRRATEHFTDDAETKRVLWNAFHAWERDNRRRGEEAALTALALKGTARGAN